MPLVHTFSMEWGGFWIGYTTTWAHSRGFSKQVLLYIPSIHSAIKSVTTWFRVTG